MDESMDALLTKEEVANLLRISERKIDRERSAGALAYIKLGGRVLFESAEVRRYVAAHIVKVQS